MKKILIADDHHEILEVVTEVLTYEDFEVRGYSKGSEVLSAVIGFKPDLIILDLKLGEDDGAALCKQIKSTPGFEKTPVIIYSAYLTHTPDAAQYGCDDVITKPFDIEELVSKINRLI